MPSASRSIAAPESCGGVGAFGERFGRGRRDRRVSIATQRSPERMSGRASLASRAMSAAVSSTPSNTADQRTFASWFAPTDRLRRLVDEHAQRRRRLAQRQRGHAHVEAGRDELRTGDGHQLPRFVLAQDHLAAPHAARAGPARAACARGARSRLRGAARAEPAFDDRVLDRDELALRARTRTPRGATRCRRRENRGARRVVRARR